MQWPNVPVLPIKDSTVDTDCVIVGILFKDMALKPTILTNYLDSMDIVTAGAKQQENYVSDTDQLYIEDQNARCALTLAETPSIISGIVVACMGRRGVGGRFSAKNIIFPYICRPAKELPLTATKCVAIVASPRSVSPMAQHKTNILRDVLVGSLGDKLLAQTVARLIILGDTLPSHGTADTTSTMADEASWPPLQALDELDEWLYTLALSLPIDLVPGSNDPTNFALPQQPLLPNLFPKASQLASFRCVPNPYHFAVDQTNFVVTTGQGVEDVLRFTTIDEPVEALELLVKSMHLCPSAPDTLPCYPFAQEDPFCLPLEGDELPNIIVSGPHANCSTKKLDDTLVYATVSEFATTGKVLLIEIPTLETKVLEFA